MDSAKYCTLSILTQENIHKYIHNIGKLIKIRKMNNNKMCRIVYCGLNK